MYGKAPQLNDACKVAGYRDDVLVFTYLSAPKMKAEFLTMHLG
jgi:hypothetical protein